MLITHQQVKYLYNIIICSMGKIQIPNAIIR